MEEIEEGNGRVDGVRNNDDTFRFGWRKKA